MYSKKWRNENDNDKKSKNNIEPKKICLIAAIVFVIILLFAPDIALNILILGLFGCACIYLIRYFYSFPKYFKLANKKYPLKDGITKDMIFNNAQTKLIEKDFRVSNSRGYLIIESDEFKNIEYRVYINQDKRIFQVKPYYNFKGRLLHGRYSPKLYKSAVANNEIIADIIQNNI